MRPRISTLAAGLATLYAIGPWVSAQPRGGNSEPRIAAVASEKGGQDIFGAWR
jgi:hypothetical protein